MCVFCKIINGDIPSKKIYEDDDLFNTVFGSKFDVEGSTFGEADVNADLDAVNIMENFYKPDFNGSLTLCMYDYYNNVTEAKRIKQFSDRVFNNKNYSSIEELAEDIYTRMALNEFIQILADDIYEYTFAYENKYVKACIKAFARHVMAQ